MISSKIARSIEQAERQGYTFSYWRDFDFSKLSVITYQMRAGSKKKEKYNDCIIMFDTETSKKDPEAIAENHVVAWTISIRAYRINICTLYGHAPDTLIECMDKIHNILPGDHTLFFAHNLPYDYTFERRFMFDKWGYPEHQLNVKPHYPLVVEFNNGIILRDSLLIAQRSLEKWADDMNVEHKKAYGKWDYDRIRSQREEFTKDELEYIEHDTLAGVECLDALRYALKKHTYSIPYTATGIPREECRKRGKENRAKDLFNRLVPTWEQQQKLECVFHGGYTHANRHMIDRTIKSDEEGYIKCYDFASSYPYCMLAEKYPMEKFHPIGSRLPEDIIKEADEYAFIFKLILKKVRLKDDFIPMPCLQFSKCIKTINAITDNGRILCAAYAELYICEQDLIVIMSQYDYELAACVEVEASIKDYLPKWYRDYTFELFKNKTELKGGDPVAYALAKSKLNSLYGLSVTKPCRDIIEEFYEDGADHDSGEYYISGIPNEETYNDYVKNYNNILVYFWGVYTTAYAFRHLFQLGECIDGIWIYSDTDSCYATGWNEEKILLYNEECKRKLRASGYGSIVKDGREYWLGVAESEGEKDLYTEFKVQGAKRYCGRCKKDGKIHITVAGVPKKGAECLADDIENFKPGLIFDGIRTGKKTHTYFFNEIYRDENGNLTGDSINLSPCDYKLDTVDLWDWEDIFSKEIEVQIIE